MRNSVADAFPDVILTRALKRLRTFVVAVVAAIQVAHAYKAEPLFSVDAPSPYLLRVVLRSDHALEFEREPPLTRTQTDWLADSSRFERHAALPGTAYRYRARERASAGRSAGPWTDWIEIQTAAAADAPPAPPRLLQGQSAAYLVSLQWRSDDRGVNGFVIERCSGPDECRTAAIVSADQRAFEHHTLHAGHYRIAAFNENGMSAFSPRTGLLGQSIPIRPAIQAQTLRPEDSQAAQLIDPASLNDPQRYCTTPAALIADGWVYTGVRGVLDLYQSPDSCGTGGCIFRVFSSIDGCYSTEPDSGVLTTTAPFSGREEDAAGVVISNSSGNAYSGLMVIYDGETEVDRYRWEVFEPPFSRLLPPFGEYAGSQFPDLP